MRISIYFEAVSSRLALPIHYNHLVQSFIYRSLRGEVADFYNEQEFSYGKRLFKLFMFLRLLSGRRRILKNSSEIVFGSKVYLKIGALDVKLLESLATHLVKNGWFYIGKNLCELRSVEVETLQSFSRPVLVKTLLPITIRKTLEATEGSKKNYYTPFESEFFDRVLENLKKKAKACYGDKAPLLPTNDSYIKLVRISRRNKVVVNFKQTWIEA